MSGLDLVHEPALAEAIRKWQRGDYTSCYRVIERFAEAGNSEAQNILGLSYETEHWGLSKNRDKAVYWLEQATQNGHPTAPIALAMLFDPTNDLVESGYASADIAERNSDFLIPSPLFDLEQEL